MSDTIKRLRELREKCDTSGIQGDEVRELDRLMYDALPALLAVVEAAQSGVNHHEDCGYDLWRGCSCQSKDVIDALAALEDEG